MNNLAKTLFAYFPIRVARTSTCREKRQRATAVSAVLCAGIVACALVRPASASEHVKYQEKVLLSFRLPDGGWEPRATLLEVGGKLYGTAANGGANRGGAVFSFDTNTGVETVLHSFCAPGCKGGDGWEPEAGLVNVDGTLYGVTRGGGAYGGGAVFSLDPGTRAEAVVHSFCPNEDICKDGAEPNVRLTDVKGILYGTTVVGGPVCADSGTAVCGTIFSLDPKTGVEKQLFGFTNFAEGTHPETSLTYWKGTFYGTAAFGGNTRCGGIYGCGTMFSFDPKTRTEKTLYTFCSLANCADGYVPYSSLINVDGVFYGTTSTGGGSPNGPYYGTLYSFDPGTGTMKVLHSFCSEATCTDGANPYGDLIKVGRKLYGTTSLGGAVGWGTVFSFDLGTGVETVLYSFQKVSDGHWPEAGLTEVNGTLYGTTLHGGVQTNNGSLFSLTK